MKRLELNNISVLLRGSEGLKKHTRQLESALTSPTVDPEEIVHLSNLVSDWWDAENKFVILHTLNELRVPFICNNLCLYEKIPQFQMQSKKPLKGLKLLEVGCGGGILSEPLSKTGALVTGLDVSKELINLAIDHAKRDPLISGLDYKHGNIEDYSQENKEKFDAVILSEVIEHVTKKELLLKCCLDVVKPGGSIFITTQSKTLFAWIAAIGLAEYVLRMIPVGTHQYQKFITAETLTALLKKMNCKTLRVQGSVYYPWLRKWGWRQSDKICYALHAVKSN